MSQEEELYKNTMENLDLSKQYIKQLSDELEECKKIIDINNTEITLLKEEITLYKAAIDKANEFFEEKNKEIEKLMTKGELI